MDDGELKNTIDNSVTLVSIALLSLLIAVYLVTSSGGLHIADEVSLFSVTESLVKRGAFDTNSIAWTQWVLAPAAVQGAFGLAGDVFSKKGTAPSFVAIPFYLIGWILPTLSMLQTALWSNMVITALAAVLLVKTVLALGYRLSVALCVGLVFGLATIALPYASTFFSEPLATFLLVAIFYLSLCFRQTRQIRYVTWMGFCAGVWLATSIAYAVLLLPFGVYVTYVASMQKKWEQILRTGLAFVLPFVIVIGALGYYNWIRFGSPIGTGRDLGSGEWFTADWAQGVWGLLFSPYRGFFLYTPLAFGSVFAFPSFVRRHRAEGWLIAAIGVAAVELFGKWWMWWSGISWGPRFLVPLAAFAALVLVVWLDQFDWRRLTSWLFAGLIGVSILVQTLAVSANYVNYELTLREKFPTNPDDSFKFGPPAQFDLLASPIFGQVKLLHENWKSNITLGWVIEGNLVWGVPLLGALVVLLSLGAFWLTRRKHSRMAWLVTAIGIAAVLLLAFDSAQVCGSRPEFGDPSKSFGAALMQVSKNAGDQDGIVSIAPYFYQVPMVQYRGRLPIYGYSQETIPLHAETEAVLSRALVRHPRLWFITVGLSPANPENGIEVWLAQNAFKADDQWFDDARLVTFVTAREMKQLPIQQQFGDVRLASAKTNTSNLRAGDTLAIELTWEAHLLIKNNLHAFVQLLAPDASLVVGNDGVPAAGYSPSMSWQPSELVSDRRGLVMPTELAPGEYTLIAGIYDAATGDRLKTPDGKNFVVLDHPVVR